MSTPTLHDDRIETMRSSVMHAVDQDVRRRGRRVRNAIGLTAAGVLVVGFGGYAVSSIDTSGSGEADGVSADSSVSRSDAGSAAAMEDSAGGDSAALPSPADEPAAADQDRQVVTTGSISVTVTRPRDTAAKISAYVERLGGRVDNRSESGTGDDATASLQVRVPSDRVSSTIERLGTWGKVSDVSLQNDDVTSVSKDLDARIDALQISVDRLEDILARASTSKEVISAESALTKRQEQLESLQSQKRQLDNQVELSTITIDLTQKASVDTVEPGGFTGGLRDGWNALVSTVNHVVEVAGTLLPWAVVVLVLVGAARLVTRRRHWN